MRRLLRYPNFKIVKPTKLGDGPLIVTFDPLDGSSVIGQNWAVGTIVGIWPHDDKILVGKTGRAMIGGCCCIYGPRLSMVYYNDITDCVDELAYLGSKSIIYSQNSARRPNGL
jgi:fructose-1,6-bisphosphatase